MAKSAVLQVRTDSELKQQFEKLCLLRHMSVAEGVRNLMKECVEAQELSFAEHAKANESAVTRPRLQRSAISSHDQNNPPSAFGIFAAYADKTKNAQEKTAWANAACAKHKEARA